jgi:hypothetical protein
MLHIIAVVLFKFYMEWKRGIPERRALLECGPKSTLNTGEARLRTFEETIR